LIPIGLGLSWQENQLAILAQNGLMNLLDFLVRAGSLEASGLIVIFETWLLRPVEST